ncbi:hypothetical protein GTV15_00310, partial [Streptomyces sp. SID7803]|nr:hypothetical protein [Streptomyces sp. SID7803]
MVEQKVAAEEELLLAPDFFVALGRSLPGIGGGVDVRLKRGRFANELSRYRYEVVITKAPTAAQPVDRLPQLPWADLAPADVP